MVEAPPVSTVRVLVVDDSVVVRRVVTRALADEHGVEVIGAARDGRDALAKIESLRPDVVILDLEMPGMGGLEALPEIRRKHPGLPVIIYSHLTAPAAAATLQALALGATEFALKPRADGLGLAEQSVRIELLPLIRALVAPKAHASIPAPSTRAAPTGTVDAVVIAISTGGPNALAALIPRLPDDLPVPVLIVQHMPPLFTRTLAERLDRASTVSVVEAAAGDDVVAGRVYVAPGGHHMALSRSGRRVVVVVHDGPPEHSCRPAADVLFRAAVDVYGGQVLAVVMTGMGHDGLAGARAVHEAGGMVIAQSKPSSVIAGMPGAVADAGLADAVVPLGRLGSVLTRCVLESR
jgi:two-component system chemotaxis response regulator CheB